MTTTYLLERAWIGGRVESDVLVEIEGGRFTRVEPRNSSLDDAVASSKDEFRRPTDETRALAGLTLPGLANCHSHAFHRALRGRTQRDRGTFWTWRERMYDVAGRLDPDSYRRLATAVFREMVSTGITTVGEFHYLHHQPDGTPYDDPNAMGRALIEAAHEAGLRISLLDACYLAGGFRMPVEGVQVRYSDGDAARWADRVADLKAEDDVVIGAAIHSVRAVPRDQLPHVTGSPLHVHLSEQKQENDACLAAYGVTPTQLLAEVGVLGRDTTAVHATHLTDGDIALLGASGTTSCFCPTTERDLADGIGPSRRLVEAGSPISLGSDSHAVIDLFEEMRGLEMHERLVSHERGHWQAADLLGAATAHASLGFADAGEIRVGRRADLVTIDTRSERTAGTGADAHTAVFAATGTDVVHVVCDGRVTYQEGDEIDIGLALDAAINELWA